MKKGNVVNLKHSAPDGNALPRPPLQKSLASNSNSKLVL